MTPQQITIIRHQLLLSAAQMAPLLGYVGPAGRQMVYDLERGRRTLREAQRRLLEAYLAGYRPADWPDAPFA